MRSPIPIMIAVALVAGLTAPASGQPARAARGECTLGFLCGRIYNHDARYKLLITNDWGRYKDRRTWRIVNPRSSGRDAGVLDVDGFYVGRGCKVKLAGLRWIGPGWYKIRDGQYIQVTDIRC
jgi:hypothetical protein